jgi:hypothetical protein
MPNLIALRGGQGQSYHRRCVIGDAARCSDRPQALNLAGIYLTHSGNRSARLHNGTAYGRRALQLQLATPPPRVCAARSVSWANDQGLGGRRCVCGSANPAPPGEGGQQADSGGMRERLSQAGRTVSHDPDPPAHSSGRRWAPYMAWSGTASPDR